MPLKIRQKAHSIHILNQLHCLAPRMKRSFRCVNISTDLLPAWSGPFVFLNHTWASATLISSRRLHFVSRPPLLNITVCVLNDASPEPWLVQRFTNERQNSDWAVCRPTWGAVCTPTSAKFHFLLVLLRLVRGICDWISKLVEFKSG